MHLLLKIKIFTISTTIIALTHALSYAITLIKMKLTENTKLMRNLNYKMRRKLKVKFLLKTKSSKLVIEYSTSRA